MIIQHFVFSSWHIANRPKPSLVVKPLHPGQCGSLYIIRPFPRAVFANNLRIVEGLQRRGIEPLIAVTHLRPPQKPDKPPPAIKAPWRKQMMAKLQTDEANKQYRKRKSTVEPVFGIIKSILGFTRFQLRGIEKVKMEWMLVALAYNCKRLNAIRLNAITAG